MEWFYGREIPFMEGQMITKNIKRKARLSSHHFAASW